MKGFDANFIAEVKSKANIVDFVSRYVQLEQRGNNFFGKCPFHHEKTASFCVSAVDQFYHCFGCKKSGDVINFVREIEAVDFADAVKIVAEKVGVALPEISYNNEEIKEQKRKKERLLSLMKDTALFYVNNLRSSAGALHRDYLDKRSITSEFITKFGMGASLDYDGLPNYLLKKGYTEKEMVAAGACGEKNGRCYDFLAGRLIIPMIDQFNNVVAFSGRLVKDIKNSGKYVNTRETSIFSKGKLLFNINNLKKLKNERGLESVIVVEGHMDVVSLVQNGFANVVASMGTALTKDHARMLKRYCEKILICYDGDFAGQSATVRGLEILKEEGLDVKVVSMPDGMDPDDVVKKLGKEGYENCLKNAMPLIDFKLSVIKNSFDLSTVDGKRKYVTNAIRVIKESPSPAEQEDLLRTVKEITGYTYDSLNRELYATAETAMPLPKTSYGREMDLSEDKNVVASRFILYSYLFNRRYAEEVDINILEFTLPEHKAIYQYIIDKKKNGGQVKFSDLYDIFEDDYEKELSEIAGLETDENKRFDGEYFYDCVRTIRMSALDRRLDELKFEFSSKTDVEERRQVANKMREVIEKKNQLM